MKCITCSANLIPATTSYKLSSVPPIEIHYLEAYRCPQCNEVYLTRTSLKKIEEIENSLHRTDVVTWETTTA